LDEEADNLRDSILYTNEAYKHIVNTEQPEDGIKVQFLSIKTNDENEHPQVDRRRLYSIHELLQE
jgi:hypothetical protein